MTSFEETKRSPIKVAAEDFYAKHDVALEEALNSPLPYRFVRLSPHFDSDETLQLLKVR
mgnify:CR=1 FL=1